MYLYQGCLIIAELGESTAMSNQLQTTETCTSKQTIFVMKDLRSNLLGLLTIFVLNLIVRVAEVSEDYYSVI